MTTKVPASGTRHEPNAIQEFSSPGDMATFCFGSLNIINHVPELLEHGYKMVLCLPVLDRFRSLSIAETECWNMACGLGEYLIRKQ